MGVKHLRNYLNAVEGKWKIRWPEGRDNLFRSRQAVQMADSLVSVIIVNYNGGALLTDCVRHVLASRVAVEVLVSDNGSRDGSIEQLQAEVDDHRLHIIRNGCNMGFAKALNVPLVHARGEYLLFLNPDALMIPDTLANLLAYFNTQSDTGMIGCLICNADGSEQAGCRRRVPTPMRAMIRILHLERPFPFLNEKGVLLHQQPLPDKPVKVEAISGAFMLVRREALEEVGPMDEGYFLHCEDLDWCMRFRQKGWSILFVPHVEIVHHQGTCSHSQPVRVEWHKHKGMVRFYRKFFRHQYPALLMWLVIFAVWIRFFVIASFMNIRKLTALH